MFNEIIIVVCLIAIGIVAGIHFNYAYEIKKYYLKLSWVRQFIALSIVFLFIFILGYASKNVSKDSAANYYGLFIGLIVAIVSYRLRIKIRKSKGTWGRT